MGAKVTGAAANDDVDAQVGDDDGGGHGGDDDNQC